MPGFGSGPFGHIPFGHVDWSKTVLYDTLPEIYKNLDAENDFALRTLIEALQPTFDRALSKIDNWSDLRDAHEIRTKYNNSISLRLGKVRLPDSPIEQAAADGTIDAQRQFSSSIARFRPEDLGKTLIISGSSQPINNKDFKVAAILTSNRILCDPPLVTDAGPVQWELKGFPDLPENEIVVEVRGGPVVDITPGWTVFDGASEFSVVRRAQFFPMGSEARSLTEREGSQGFVRPDGRFQTEVAFDQRDVGKPFTIALSTIGSNNGKFEIRSVDPVNGAIISLQAPLLVTGSNYNGGVTYVMTPGHSMVSVAHINPGPSSSLSVEVKDNTVNVYLATNISGAVTSTSAQVVAAILASSEASALVSSSAQGDGSGVVGVQTATVIPGICLTPSPSNHFWAKLPFPVLTLSAAVPPLGVVEQESLDLSITAPYTASSPAMTLTSVDVGKVLWIRGSSLGNDGSFTIQTVVDSNTCVVSSPIPLVTESGLTWELRTAAFLESTSLYVESFAPPLISLLASDYALTVDDRESEYKQRSWVDNASQWIDLKGSATGYEIIAAIEGFSAFVTGLYRVSRDIFNIIPSSHRYVIGDNTAQRYGTDGRIYDIGSTTYFTSPTAAFISIDDSAAVYIRNAAISENEGYYEIAEVLSPTTVTITPFSGSSSPENGIGGSSTDGMLHWRVARFYADLPPSKPRYDDLNVELMQSIVGEDRFRMDHFCWEDTIKDHFSITISNVTPFADSDTPTTYTIEVTGYLQATGVYSTARVVQNFNMWKITDMTGQDFYLESLPVMTAAGPPEKHTFQVFSRLAPKVGTADLRYLCDDGMFCGYCRARTLLVKLTDASIAGASNQELLDAIDIVKRRFESEVKPAHADLLPVRGGASLNPDFILLLFELAGNIEDAIEVTDSLYVIVNDTNSDTVSDTISITDSVAIQKWLLLTSTVSDTAAMTDSAAVQMYRYLSASASDTAAMSDSVGVGPVITGTNYTVWDIGGGDTMVINGFYLSGATSVTIGGTSATITGSTFSTVTVTTPSKSAGTYQIVVTTPEGASTRPVSVEFWSPSLLSNTIYLDSRYNVTIDGSNNVTDWNGADQAVAGGGPSFSYPVKVNSIFGAKPAIRFTRSSRSCLNLFTVSSTPASAGPPCSVFAVAKWTSSVTTDVTAPDGQHVTVPMTLVGGAGRGPRTFTYAADSYTTPHYIPSGVAGDATKDRHAWSYVGFSGGSLARRVRTSSSDTADHTYVEFTQSWNDGQPRLVGMDMNNGDTTGYTGATTVGTVNHTMFTPSDVGFEPKYYHYNWLGYAADPIRTATKPTLGATELFDYDASHPSNVGSGFDGDLGVFILTFGSPISSTDRSKLYEWAKSGFGVV